MKTILLALFLGLLAPHAVFAQTEPLPPYNPATEQEGKASRNEPLPPYSPSEQGRVKQPGAAKKRPHVEVWLPADFYTEGEKFPLLAFSHGFGGCAKQSVFLMQYLADHGYMVIAPDHADANCRRDVSGGGLASRLQDMRAGKIMGPEKPFRTPDAWSDATEADRRDDMESAVEYVLNVPKYKNHIDTDKMGLLGHSLGGYTVLGMAGAWPSWKDARFKAVLALSPYIDPYIARRTLGNIDIPVMYQGGTRDFGITPSVKRSGYGDTPPPKYFIEFDGAGHFAWTQLEDRYWDVIDRTSLAFFDKYLKGENVEILPDGKGGPVSTYWPDEAAAAKE